MKRSSVEDILACFLALSGKVTENFASQFARTEAVLLIVVNDVYDAVLSLHRILLVLPVGDFSKLQCVHTRLLISQRKNRPHLNGVLCFSNNSTSRIWFALLQFYRNVRSITRVFVTIVKREIIQSASF